MREAACRFDNAARVAQEEIQMRQCGIGIGLRKIRPRAVSESAVS